MSELDNIQSIDKPNIGKSALKVIVGIAVFVLIYLGSAVLTGLISAFSNNIETSTFNIIFDSQITIAYLLMYYFIAKLNKLSDNQNYLFFVVTILLSFTTNFIQGALTLLIIPPLLKKLKLIESN